MTGQLDVGILGVGAIGSVHLQSTRVIDDVNLAAAADARAENRRRATRLGASRTYGDFRDLLESESLDAVVVALPPFLHADAVVAAAENDCHAFVEKPFARSVEEADRMLAAARRADVHLGVDHTIRYQPDVRELKERYDAGHLGHVPQSSIVRVNDGPFAPPPDPDGAADWQLDPEATGGGALMDLGVHLFDVLQWFFGDLSVEFASTGRQLNLPYEDTATVVVSAESGTVGVLRCGFYQWERPPEVTNEFRLDGIAATRTTDEFTPDDFTAYAGKSALENLRRRFRGDDPAYFEPTYFYRAHYLALADFYAAILAGDPPPVDGELGRRTVELVAESYEVAGERTPSKVVADD